ncbi:MAG TPA: glycosyltransferase [Acidimicrobiales bacterium]|nr:glycosyltransferase [Acidimicrobiales bacterium]
MEIHQVVVSAAPGDAVTEAAFQLRSLLRRVGPSEMFARYVHADLEGEVSYLDAFARRPSPTPEEDVIVFHASIGEPEVFRFLRDRPERLVVDYHNISPAEWFYTYDPAFAGLLEEGRTQVAALAGRADLALADSAYNSAELESMGYRDVRVSPLIVDIDRIAGAPVSPTLDADIRAATPGPVVLFVGQLLPHKRPDFLVQAFHFLVTYLVPDAHLVMVGAQRMPRYASAVATQVAELNLRGVRLTGSVSDAELAAWYRRADLFVTASEHEGFCVPLLEALAFGLPVLARRFAAVPETLGDAGLLLPPEASPAEAAEAMAMLIADRPLADALAARGHGRLAAYDPDAARATFLRHLLSLAA